MPNRSLDFTACNLPCEHPCWRRLTKEEIEWLEKNPNRQAYTLVCIEKQNNKKPRMTCKRYCPVWNDIDHDCEIYGEHHFTPRTCPHYNKEFKQDD